MNDLFFNAAADAVTDQILVATDEIGADAVESVTEATEVISEEGRETSTVVGASETALYSGIGFLIVFAVLLVLMAFIGIMSRVMGTAKKKPEKIEAPAPAPVQAPKAEPAKAEAKDEVACDGACAMKVKLNGKEHAVSVKECVPQFTLTLDGKDHGVDVKLIDEEVDA